jgi:methyltransferase (TIGR00027 family)
MKTEQASSTAKVIAASTLALQSDGATAALVAPGAAALCELFLSGNRSDRWLARSTKNAFTRGLWRQVEALTLPGIVEHYWHRKRWIEQQVRQALRDGVQRVVVLGAGFDTLGYRLAQEQAQLQVLEVDHPATQAAKQRALAGAANRLPTNLNFLAVDLSSQPFNDAGAGPLTCVVAEGVLMYLSDQRVDALFHSLRNSPAQRVQVVFSFMTRWPDGRSGFRPRSALIERWLAWRGEPFMWSLEPQAMKAWLMQHGFVLRALASTADFTPAAAKAAGRPPLMGENLVCCERQ